MTGTSRRKTTTTHDLRGGGRPRLVMGYDHHAPAGSAPREFELLPGITIIGSAPDADLHLPGLAAYHAEVRRDSADEYTYVHLGAQSGSTVNGLPVSQKVLHTGDRIHVGNWTMSFARDEFADHGRPHGGRLGGQRHQRPQEQPRRRGASPAGGGDRAGVDPGEYF